MRPELGIVADDFTGACDVAATVSAAGLRTDVLLHPPEDVAVLPDVDCVVVALKSRALVPNRAANLAKAASAVLRSAGCRQLYQKYCSTFDSTEAGNIGPTAEAMLTCLHRDRASSAPAGVNLTTPATPDVGRTVYQGHLFVGGRLLSESSMRHHPLTPMTDSDLARLLAPQTQHEVGLVDHAVVDAGGAAVRARVRELMQQGRRHLLLDAVSNADLDEIASALVRRAREGHLDLWGGASGLASALARRLAPKERREIAQAADPAQYDASPRLVVAGSCSDRTREQVAAFDGPSVKVVPLDLQQSPGTSVQRLERELAAHYRVGARTVLVYSTDSATAVRAAQDRLGTAVAGLVESLLAAVAERAVTELGVRQLLVAGGETAGAICTALGLSGLRVGAPVSPGLAWAAPTDGRPLRVLLKSGNFGEVDLFNTAWDRP